MRKAACLALACMLIVACGNRESDRPTAVPRPYAYPRFIPYPDSSVSVLVGAIRLDVNAAATAIIDDKGHADIQYPLYGGTIMLSVNENSDDSGLASALANRRERIALNLGGHIARTDRFTNSEGYECELVVSPETALTPVQFVAVGPDRTMISGAAVLSAPGSADSIAPVVEALEHDVFTLLKSIRR